VAADPAAQRRVAGSPALAGDPAAPGDHTHPGVRTGVALELFDPRTEQLGHYPLHHATRAELLRQLDRPAQGRLANRQALRLTANPTEPALLEQRPT